MNQNLQINQTKRLVITALMAALTFAATYAVKIPTPTMGYIHPGDCLVLLCGIILGPAGGFLSAGIGSMLSDLLGGYTLYVIPTFIIKGTTALIAALLFRLGKRILFSGRIMIALFLSGLAAEANMVFGYFVNKIVKTMFETGDYTMPMLLTGLAKAFTDLPFNLLQGGIGIGLSLVLFPVLLKIPDVNTLLSSWLKNHTTVSKV